MSRLQNTNRVMRQVMDWRAAVIAGLLAGGLTMLLRMILWATAAGGSIWTPFYHSAALLLGPERFVPAGAPEAGIVAVGALAHMALSLVYTVLLAFIIHRWGLIVGILGGALFGLALYLIHYYSMTYLFPWFYPLRSWLVLVSHIFFGAIAGGLYEALERDIYVEAEPELTDGSLSA